MFFDKVDSMKREKVIAVDFDGTIVKHRFPEIGDEVPHAVEVLKRLNSEDGKRKMKKFVLYCFLILCGQTNAFGSTALPFDDVKTLTLLTPSLSLKANLYSGDEDERALPVAETEFYLLDESLVNILKKAKFKPEFLDGKRRKLKASDYLTAAAKALSSGDEESVLIALLIKTEISKHTILSLKTDYFGEANQKELKMGNYYIFGIGKTEDEIFVWHFIINIKSYNNIVELDQYNAETVFSVDE